MSCPYIRRCDHTSIWMEKNRVYNLRLRLDDNEKFDENRSSKIMCVVLVREHSHSRIHQLAAFFVFFFFVLWMNEWSQRIFFTFIVRFRCTLIAPVASALRVTFFLFFFLFQKYRRQLYVIEVSQNAKSSNRQRHATLPIFKNTNRLKRRKSFVVKLLRFWQTLTAATQFHIFHTFTFAFCTQTKFKFFAFFLLFVCIFFFLLLLQIRNN